MTIQALLICIHFSSHRSHSKSTGGEHQTQSICRENEDCSWFMPWDTVTIVHSHGAYDILQATHLQGVSLCNLNIIMSFALAVVPACGWSKAVAS